MLTSKLSKLGGAHPKTNSYGEYPSSTGEENVLSANAHGPVYNGQLAPLPTSNFISIFWSDWIWHSVFKLP